MNNNFMNMHRMVQIKTFEAINGKDLDANVNDWLQQENSNKHVTGFATIDTQISLIPGLYSCTIVYSINDKKDQW